jgi:hypothetical protein
MICRMDLQGMGGNSGYESIHWKKFLGGDSTADQAEQLGQPFGWTFCQIVDDGRAIFLWNHLHK